MKRVILTVEVIMDVPNETKSEDLRISFRSDVGENVHLFSGGDWLSRAKLIDYQTIDVDDSAASQGSQYGTSLHSK